MQNHPPNWEGYGKEGGLWKILSSKEYYFNVDEKQT